MKKRILSVLLCICLCMTILPTIVLAAGIFVRIPSVTFQVGVNKASGEVALNDASALTYEGTLPNGISSRKFGLAGIEFYGTATPEGIGSSPFLITIKDSDSTGDTVTITVAKGPQTICVDAAINDAITIPLGATYTLDTYSKDASGSKIDIAIDYPTLTVAGHQPTYTYASSDTSVATVDTNGIVTPISLGTTNITINSGTTDSYDAATAKTIALTVAKTQPTVTISGTAPTATVGAVGEKTIAATVANSYAENMDFTCSINGVSKIATRSGNGDVSFTFTAAEMNALTVGNHAITVSSAATTNNNAITGTVIGQVVINQRIDATITPATASFDKYAPADISVAKSDGDYTLASIKNGTATLASGTDYTVSGNTVTISKAYLNTIPLGSTTLTFDYGMTTNPTLIITVSDTTPIRNITVTQATGGTVSVNPTSGKVGDTITVTATPSSGYKLKNILVDGVAITGNTFVMKDANAIVTAEFEKVNYTVTVTQPTGGKITVSPETATMGDTITVTATPDSGYKLKNILVDGKAITGNTFVMKDANATVTAEFEKVAVPTEPSKDTTSPQTGDNSNMVLWVALLFISGGAVITLTVFTKRKKHQAR